MNGGQQKPSPPKVAAFIDVLTDRTKGWDAKALVKLMRGARPVRSLRCGAIDNRLRHVPLHL